jgi:hypothetical protein
MESFSFKIKKPGFMIWTAAWSAAPVRKIALLTQSVCPRVWDAQGILFRPGSREKTLPLAVVRNVVDKSK